MKNYYAILNLYFCASPADIKKAYYQLARKYHPDKNNGNAYFEEKFKEINEAYAVLSDENKRIIYHADYNDFLKPKATVVPPVNPIPFTKDNIFDIHSIPKQPLAKATPREVDHIEIKVAFLGVLFLFFFILIAYSFVNYQPTTSSENYNYIETKQESKPKNFDKEFYQSLNLDLSETHDSTLLKSNLDSLKHVFDSIMNGYYN